MQATVGGSVQMGVMSESSLLPRGGPTLLTPWQLGGLQSKPQVPWVAPLDRTQLSEQQSASLRQKPVVHEPHLLVAESQNLLQHS